MNHCVVFTVMNGPWDGKEFVFRNPALALIGRAQDCMLRLDSPDVSRRHCLLDIDPPWVTIRDLGSLNGTYLNGSKIGQRGQGQAREDASRFPLADERLEHGDVLRIGSFNLRVTMPLSHPEPAQLNDLWEMVPLG